MSVTDFGNFRDREQATNEEKDPSIEPMGDGWRETVRIDGALHKGKVRGTQLEAYEDANGLGKLRDEGKRGWRALAGRWLRERDHAPLHGPGMRAAMAKLWE